MGDTGALDGAIAATRDARERVWQLAAASSGDIRRDAMVWHEALDAVLRGMRAVRDAP